MLLAPDIHTSTDFLSLAEQLGLRFAERAAGHDADASGRLALQVRDRRAGVLDPRHDEVLERRAETGRNRIPAGERRFTEEEMKYRLLFRATQLPIAVRHRQLVQISQQCE